MVTQRDKIALEFISSFKTVTAAQVDEVAYNNIKVAYNRLNRLHQDKLIYKTRNTINKGFIYSSERLRTLKQFIHNHIRTEFYLSLRKVSDIYVTEIEKPLGSIRPDLIISCMYGGTPYHFSIEVETNSNHTSINYNKYNNFFINEYRKYFNVKPIVVYVTDKYVDGSKINFDYRHVKSNLNNIMDIFE